MHVITVQEIFNSDDKAWLESKIETFQYLLDVAKFQRKIAIEKRESMCQIQEFVRFQISRLIGVNQQPPRMAWETQGIQPIRRAGSASDVLAGMVGNMVVGQSSGPSNR